LRTGTLFDNQFLVTGQPHGVLRGYQNRQIWSLVKLNHGLDFEVE
jgi:hypothetical protein